MRHRPGFRVWSALLGVWFLLAGHEPPFAHPCFMAPRAALPAASGGTPAPAGGSHGGMAHGDLAHGDAASGAHHHAAPVGGPGDAPSPAPQCECIGDCGALAPMPTVPLARQAFIVPIELRVVPAPLVAHVARRPDAPPRVQPFANGPPVTARA